VRYLLLVVVAMTLDPDPVVVVENSVRLLTDTTFGSVMTDGDGFTLYFFAKDSKGDSNCIDGCLGSWPVFSVDELTLDSGLEADDFGTGIPMAMKPT